MTRESFLFSNVCPPEPPLVVMNICQCTRAWRWDTHRARSRLPNLPPPEMPLPFRFPSPSRVALLARLDAELDEVLVAGPAGDVVEDVFYDALLAAL